MEILGIIFFLWLIGCLFPSSGQSYPPTFGEVLGFLACAAFLIGLVFAWGYSVAGLLWFGHWAGIGDWWIIVALLGPIATPMLICGAVNTYIEHRAARSCG